MTRGLLGPAGLYVALTVALTYPLLAHFGSALPHDIGDPVLNAWILWWSTRVLPLTAPWWNAPMFYPMTGATALSEVLIGLLPITAPMEWLTHSPIAAYNAAFLLSFPLSGLAAYALALELTGRPGAATLAGVAFAFAPYRMGQLAHVQMLSYYWAPLVLLGLHRYLRTREQKWLVLFAVSWLMQALSNGYALFHVSVVVALWIVWFARPIRTAVPIAIAWLCAVLPVAPILLKYREVHRALHLARDINEIKRFGADLGDFLSAPPEIALWGGRLFVGRPETAMFPGAAVLVVGAIWLVAARRRRRPVGPPARPDQRVLMWISMVAALVAAGTLALGPWRIGPLTVTDFHKPFSIAVGARVLASIRSPWMRRAWHERSVVLFYVVAMVTLYVLALGPEPRVFGRPLLYEPPYAWLMRLPGFDTLRVPARFAMLAVLCQSMLLAFAVARWSARRSSRRTRPLVLGALAVALLVDGWAWVPIAQAPSRGPEWEDVDAVIELPPGGDGDFGALSRAMLHGRPIANGYSGYFAPHYLPLVYAVRDRQYSALYEVAAGRRLGVAVNRSSADAGATEAALDAMVGVTRGRVQDGWATFTVHAPAPAAVRLGTQIPVSSVRANRQSEDIGRLTDHNVATAWASGTSQIGGEDVIVDLGSTQAVGGIVFEMGAFAFGFPRALEIDVSTDADNWRSVWRGQPAVLTVHAAVADAGTVPLTLDIGRASGQFLRFRQTGTEPGIPWWIAELKVYAPDEATADAPSDGAAPR